MHVDWLARFECYYTMWSSVSSLHFDVNEALVNQRDGNIADLDYFTRNSLWHYACFLSRMDAFENELGGLWITPDPKAEQLIADAGWFIRKSTPMTKKPSENLLRAGLCSP
jgi:hypothetical protein